jgi:hypothetical protein
MAFAGHATCHLQPPRFLDFRVYPPMKNSKLPALLGSAALCALSGSLLAGTPRLTQIFPAGAQRGGEIEISCTGQNLGDPREFLFEHPGFTVTDIKSVNNQVKAKVQVAPDAKLGEHRLRLVTKSGISDVRLFFVTPFPMVAEVEDNKNPNATQAVPLGTTVYGHAQNDDQDTYEIEAKKGQRISAEVIGVRVQTQNIFDPLITITKADGTVLASVDDIAYSQQDPVASLIAPEDGKYRVSIKDSTNVGPGTCGYLLNIGSFPRPLAVYPAGGPSGTEVKVTFIGDPAGPIEKTVKLPAEPNDRFEVFAEQEQPAPQPNFMRVSNMVNALEVEPNDDITKTQPAQQLPVAFNGIIEKANDVDCFKFTATKGQDYDVTAYARRLRSPLDTIVEIYNDKGTRLATNDDAGSPDSYIRFKAPADGDYVVGIRDQLNQGGANFVYRIELKPAEPRLTTWLPEMTQNQNQDRRAIPVPKGNRYASLVRIKRWDVGGDVAIEPKDLPAGVQVHAGPIDKSVDTIPVVFEAAEDAAPTARAFEILAKVTNPPEAAKTPSSIEHLVDIAENSNQRPYYTIQEDKFAVAVTDESPVKLTFEQPKVPILQSGAMGLKVKAERKGDFKGPINLALLYSPPGIGTAGTIVIPADKDEGIVTISANKDAPLSKWKICVVGNADFGKGSVWISTQLGDLEVAAPFVSGQIQRTFCDQGDETNVVVKLDQKIEFAGKAKITLSGLPPGVTASEAEITKDDKEVKITVKASKEAQAGQHKQLFAQFTLVKDGEAMVTSFAQGGVLRIDKATVAKNEEPKK